MHFASGGCFRGESCFFLHPAGGDAAPASLMQQPAGAMMMPHPGQNIGGLSAGMQGMQMQPPYSPHAPPTGGVTFTGGGDRGGYGGRGGGGRGGGYGRGRGGGGPQQPAPPPVIIELQPGTHAYSIDVECIADGLQHNDRTTAQIALVDGAGGCVLDLYVKPDKDVISYLTPLTGLTAELLAEKGQPLEQALATLKSGLPKNAVLVGQNIVSALPAPTTAGVHPRTHHGRVRRVGFGASVV